MAALKGLVATLAVLIVIAMTAIGWGLYRKASDPDFRFLGGADPAPAADAAAGFGDVSLGLAPGCTIADVRPDGKRVYVLIEGGPDCPGLAAIDAETGAVLGTVRPGR